MGRITDEIGEPIMFAGVVLNSIPIIGALSDDEGRFSLNNILPGKYDIEISSLRYETSVIEDVIVKKGDNIELRIEVILEDEVQDLKPIIYIYPEDTTEVQVNLD
ncbi:MAG: carboxypeptidase-like regulatory domain-containing protein, partial [Crocinitomicaceae bacterium]|nr:carboxypeptidase-like regulatory domain-containing protein [Crocinitomicaceae bacterium]